MTSNKNEENINYSKINIKVTAKRHCFDGLMGAMNTRAQSPLHSKMEDLIWTMKCMKNLRQFTVTFATDCL